MKIIIIGGVAAGAATALKLNREVPEAEIIIFEKSSKISFSNCGLPYGLSGFSKPDQLAPKDFKKVEAKGIKVKILTEVIKINEKNKEITARSIKTNKLENYSFDKLVVTTGARALKLPIQGIDKENKVFSLRTFDDMEKIISNLKGMEKVLIIGAGFIGVEVAENLRNKGMKVHLVETREKIAGFDYDISSFIEEKLRINGVNLILGQKVSEIKSKINKFVVNNEEFGYDIIITTGITPNTEIFKGTSVIVDEKGIVKTDKYMRTSSNDIYAAGDIVYTKHIVTGKNIFMPLARQANAQGRVIADHIAGIKTKGQYPTTGASGFTMFGETFAKVGLSEAATKFMEYKHRIVMASVSSNATYFPSGKLIMKMIFHEKNNKLLGLQAIGKHADKAVDAFAVALTAGMDIYDLERLNLVYHPSLSTTSNPLNTIAQVAINELRYGFSSICPKAIYKEQPNSKIIDVRIPEQHRINHLKGAINIPLEELSVETVGQDLNQEIVVHCNSGFTSSFAARKLISLGYTNVKNIYGGNNMYQLMIKK